MIKKVLTYTAGTVLFLFSLLMCFLTFESIIQMPLFWIAILVPLVYLGYYIHYLLKTIVDRSISNIFIPDEYKEGIPRWASTFKDVNLNIGMVLFWAAMGINYSTLFIKIDLEKLMAEPNVLLGNLCILFWVIAIIPSLAFVFKQGLDEMLKNKRTN